MGRISINESDDWHLEHDQQDIRGWELHDASGATLGRVHDLIADTDRGVVETVVLDTGEEFQTDIIDIGYDDKIVYLASARAAQPVIEDRDTEAKAYRDTPIRRRKRAKGEGVRT